jgi:hypothetical protein
MQEASPAKRTYEVYAFPGLESWTTKRILKKSMKFTTKSLMQVLACTVVTLGAASLVYAAATPNIDVSGTWTWSGGGGRGGRGGMGGPGGAGGGGGGGGARAGGGGARGGGGGTNTLVLKANVTTGVVTGTLTATFGGFGAGRGAGGGRGGAGGGGGGGGGGGFGGGAGGGMGAMPAPTPVDIQNGKIAGNLLTFQVTRAGRGEGAPMTTNMYSGIVSNTVTPWTITGTIVGPGRGGAGEMTTNAWTATKQATP